MSGADRAHWPPAAATPRPDAAVASASASAAARGAPSVASSWAAAAEGAPATASGDAACASPAATRPMRVDDLDAVMAIEVACYSFAWTRGNFIDSLAAGHVARVAVGPDDAVLGYFVAMAGVDEMHLLNLSVAPAQQRRGLARQMLDELAGLARRRGDTQLWLEVRQSNERARRLYRGQGFEEVGLRRGYYPAGHGRREDAVVMRRGLDDRGPHALD